MSDRPIVLPEVRWTWRRVFAFGRTLLFCALLAAIIWKLPTAAESAATPLKWLALAIVAALVVDALLYMAGATATDFKNPSTSVNHSRTNRTSRSSRARSTKSSCLPMPEA